MSNLELVLCAKIKRITDAVDAEPHCKRCEISIGSLVATCTCWKAKIKAAMEEKTK